MQLGPGADGAKYEVVCIDEWEKVIKFSTVKLVSPPGLGKEGQGVVVSISGKGALL